MHQLGYAALGEVTLATGRRVDAMAIDAKGEISVVEVKSSIADFRSDNKWHEYGEYCDRFYFAVPAGVSPGNFAAGNRPVRRRRLMAEP